MRLILWDGFTLPQAATILGISKTTANEIGRAAVARLVDILNGVPDEDASTTRQYAGARHVMTNATARAVTSSQWEGDQR